MTTSHAGVLSGRAGALLGAIAVLLAGCTAAGGGSGTRAAQARRDRARRGVPRDVRAIHLAAGGPRPARRRGGVDAQYVRQLAESDEIKLDRREPELAAGFIPYNGLGDAW